MSRFETFFSRVSRLPAPLLALLIFTRFLTGIGLGAVLAAPKKHPWRTLGVLLMIIATLAVLPSAMRVLGNRGDTD